MASTKQPFPRNLFRGVNQSFGRHQLASGEVWNLLNFRPFRGKLQVVPPLVNYFNMSLLTGESTHTQIKHIQLVRNLNSQLRYLILNHKNARFVDPSTTSTQVLIPTILQTHKPDNKTVTGECLLYGFNVTDFSALNDEIEVEIQTGTTFRWRRNAGSWTSGVTIGPEVALGANGLKVSFQDDEAYTAGNVWKWKRFNVHPYTGGNASTYDFPFQSSVYNKDIYLGGIERNIMRVRDDFLTSVGYTRVYGKYTCVFQNHLFVGQYAAGVHDPVLGIVDGYDAATTPFRVGWSHLENPDQFFSTDVNEADEYPFPQQAAHDWANLGMTGLADWNDQLYVYLPDSVKIGNYVGLPTVMQFRTVHPKIGNIFPAGLVVGQKGHYFISRNDVHLFNGAEFKSIGQKIIEKFKTEIVPVTDNYYTRTFGYYDSDRNEVVFTYWMLGQGGTYQARQMIYQELTDEWFFRNLPSASTSATDIYCQEKLSGSRNVSVYGGLGVVYQDWVSGTPTTHKDDVLLSSTPGFTQPLIETGSSDYGHKYAVKELDTVFLDFYHNNTSIPVILGLGITPTLSKPAVYEDVANYNPETAQFDWTTFKKKSGRIICYRFKLGDRATAVYAGIFHAYEEQIYGIPNQTEK